jgi:hypothetical protein
MGSDANVLWELMTGFEDEQGYHAGADISVLSQYPKEKEEVRARWRSGWPQPSETTPSVA